MSLVKAGVYGVVAVTATKVAIGSSGGSGGSETITAKVMDLPAGQWLVAAVGLVIIGYAVNLVRRGWTEKFAEHLDTEGKLGYSGAAYLLLGKVGHIAKGIALGHRRRPVRATPASPTSRASPAASTRPCRRSSSSPSGPVMLIAIGVGIACYGLFCFARARHLDR